MTNLVTTPDVTTTVDQSFFLAPLGGPQHPQTYLDRFPDSIYNKGLDTHLVRFMYALLGPSGVGWLRKNYLDARLLLEDYGVDNFDLDRFYGDPIKFGRILEETYDDDPRALLSREDWQRIRAQDAQYRNRALDYVTGVRAGTTPQGIHLVAKSGLGHECEVIENYRYIYDQLSDDPLGLEKFGATDSTEEIIIVPRRELPQDDIQLLTIVNSPTGGTFQLFFPVGNESVNTTIPLAFNATVGTIKAALEAIASIGTGNIEVSGGPLPDTPIHITFVGDLAIRDLPEFQVINALTGPVTPIVYITTEQNGVDQSEQISLISPRDKHYLRDALDHAKPVTTIVNYGRGSGLKINQIWNQVATDSIYHEVVRFVTGQSGVKWPAVDSTHWIESSLEHKSLKSDVLNHHYRGFHNLGSIIAYAEDALSDPDYLDDRTVIESNYRNSHLGPFNQYQQILYEPLVTSYPFDHVFSPDQISADYAEPLTVTSNENDVQLVNGIYPADYVSLPGVPEVKYKDDQFWASMERPTGDDYIEIDLGRVQVVNYIYFEATRKPYDIQVSYDLLDASPARRWEDVQLAPNLQSVESLGHDVGSRNPWVVCEIWPQNGQGNPIFTRFIRIKFARRNDTTSPFTSGTTLLPYSIEVRNLRVARNVS